MSYNKYEKMNTLEIGTISTVFLVRPKNWILESSERLYNF